MAALRAPGRVGGLVFLDGDGLDTGAGARHLSFISHPDQVAAAITELR